MKLLIDRAAVAAARRINSDRSADLRTYYLIGSALIVCRNGLDLHTLAGQVVDATAGWDIAQPGFAPDDQIGHQRTKITIYRALPSQRRARTLTAQLAAANPQQSRS